MDSFYIDIRNESKWVKEAFKNKDMVSAKDLIEKIEDLLDELEEVKEEYEDFKRDVEDNYKPIPISEQLDISDRDFI